MARSTYTDWIILVLLLAVIAAAGFYFLQQRDPAQPTPAVVVPETPTPAADEPQAPRHPLPDLDFPDRETLVELPSLADSDAYFNLTLVDAFGEAVERMLREDAGVERFVTTIDNLPRDKLSERLRPIDGAEGTMAVQKVGDREYVIDPQNYARYEAYVSLFEAASVEDIHDAYRRFYPLLQQAYESLGYPDAYFNDRLIEVIDHLLATPAVEQPVKLVRPHVLYEYADPSLEALSSGQKILVRMGPANAKRVKAKLRQLRSLLASPPG